MKDEEVIEINGGLSEEVKERIRSVGVKGLSIEKAQEYGFFERISFLLCAMHASISAAYRIYGGADYLFQEYGAKRYDIKKACTEFESAFEKFINFWRREGYQDFQGAIEMNGETEALYHQVMRWAQLPESWNLGDPQHTDDETDVLIRIETDDKILRFFRSVVESEALEDVKEEWCVTKYDTASRKQTTVEEGMDKASAQMVAKRMSANDENNIYTASILQTITERRTEVCPYKAYKGGKSVGSIRKVLKKKD